MRAFAVGQRREMAETAVARRRVSIALACRTFAVSETCFRDSPKLQVEKQAIVRHWFGPNGGEIADLLVGLMASQKNLGVWVMFSAPAQCPGPCLEPQKGLPHLLRTGTEPSYQAPQAVKAGQTRRLGGARAPEHDLALGLHGRPVG